MVSSTRTRRSAAVSRSSFSHRSLRRGKNGVENHRELIGQALSVCLVDAAGVEEEVEGELRFRRAGAQEHGEAVVLRLGGDDPQRGAAPGFAGDRHAGRGDGETDLRVAAGGVPEVGRGVAMGGLAGGAQLADELAPRPLRQLGAPGGTDRQPLGEEADRAGQQLVLAAVEALGHHRPASADPRHQRRPGGEEDGRQVGSQPLGQRGEPRFQSRRERNRDGARCKGSRRARSAGEGEGRSALRRQDCEGVRRAAGFGGEVLDDLALPLGELGVGDGRLVGAPAPPSHGPGEIAGDHEQALLVGTEGRQVDGQERPARFHRGEDGPHAGGALVGRLVQATAQPPGEARRLLDDLHRRGHARQALKARAQAFVAFQHGRERGAHGAGVDLTAARIQDLDDEPGAVRPGPGAGETPEALLLGGEPEADELGGKGGSHASTAAATCGQPNASRSVLLTIEPMATRILRGPA